MPQPKTITQIPLPKAWSTQVKSAVVHVIALAQYALIYSRSWAADGSNQRVRLDGHNRGVGLRQPTTCGRTGDASLDGATDVPRGAD